MNQKENSKANIDLRCVEHNDLISQAILDVLPKLPSDVGEFVQERCLFISVGEGSPSSSTAFGVVARPKNETFWIITLYDGIPPEYVERTVAGECATAWISHKRLSVEPESLLSLWGFDDPAVDYVN